MVDSYQEQLDNTILDINDYDLRFLKLLNCQKYIVKEQKDGILLLFMKLKNKRNFHYRYAH